MIFVNCNAAEWNCGDQGKRRGERGGMQMARVFDVLLGKDSKKSNAELKDKERDLFCLLLHEERP